MQKRLILFLSVSFIFIAGCYTYRPAFVSFPVFARSAVKGSIMVAEESITKVFWDKLDKETDIYEKNIKVRALNTLEKILLEVGHPSALEDFNDDRADLDPHLIHVSIDGQKQNNISINNGLFYFSFDMNNTGVTSSKYIVDLDYNNLFKTRIYIYIYWLNEQEFKKIQQEKLKTQAKGQQI